ncbi:MAG: hypothetical protein ACK53A_05300 [Gemmatimonadota bacterium]
MNTRDILERLFGDTDAEVEPTPGLDCHEHDNGLVLTLYPPSISEATRAELWDAFAAELAAVVQAEHPEMRVRVIPPTADGLSGIIQYAYPARTNSEMESRFYWRCIVELLPHIVSRSNDRIAMARRNAIRQPSRVRAPTPPPTPQRRATRLR